MDSPQSASEIVALAQGIGLVGFQTARPAEHRPSGEHTQTDAEHLNSEDAAAMDVVAMARRVGLRGFNFEGLVAESGRSASRHDGADTEALRVLAMVRDTGLVISRKYHLPDIPGGDRSSSDRSTTTPRAFLSNTNLQDAASPLPPKSGKLSKLDYVQLEIPAHAAGELRTLEAKLGMPIASIVQGHPAWSARIATDGGETRAFNLPAEKWMIEQLTGRIGSIRLSVGPLEFHAFQPMGSRQIRGGDLPQLPSDLASALCHELSL